MSHINYIEIKTSKNINKYFTPHYSYSYDGFSKYGFIGEVVKKAVHLPSSLNKESRRRSRCVKFHQIISKIVSYRLNIRIREGQTDRQVYIDSESDWDYIIIVSHTGGPISSPFRCGIHSHKLHTLYSCATWNIIRI